MHVIPLQPCRMRGLSGACIQANAEHLELVGRRAFTRKIRCGVVRRRDEPLVDVVSRRTFIGIGNGDQARLESSKPSMYCEVLASRV